jgi:uncharacterized repeat protein (TIGR01451 family)
MNPGYPDDVVVLPQVLELTASKSVSSPELILPGSLVTYTLVLSNTGTNTVLQTVLIDSLPVEVAFGGFVSSGGAQEQDGTISWAGDIAAGTQVRVVFTATVNLDFSLYGETITNTMGYDSPYAGSGSASVAFTLAQAPDVTLAKSVVVPGLLDSGDVLTYTLELTNTGEAAALGLLMTDVLPPGITFGDWVLQNGAVESNGVITWQGDLPAEKTFVFTASVDYDPAAYGQTITNTAEFTSANAGDGAASAGFAIGTPVLGIDKSVETLHAPAQPGDPITYTVVLRNDGTTGAVDVHLWDMLPDEVIGSDVDITVTLDAGTAYTLTIPGTLAVDVAPGSTVVNTASFENGALTGDASARFIVWSGDPVLSITKTVAAAHDPAQPGDPITYTLIVRNDGTVDAIDVHIWDILPDEVIASDVDITVTIDAGAAYTITISGTLADSLIPGSTITNIAYFAYGEQFGDASAILTVKDLNRIYLPLLMKY